MPANHQKKLRNKHGTASPSWLPEDTYPADIMISSFWLPELQTIIFCLQVTQNMKTNTISIINYSTNKVINGNIPWYLTASWSWKHFQITPSQLKLNFQRSQWQLISKYKHAPHSTFFHNTVDVPLIIETLIKIHSTFYSMLPFLIQQDDFILVFKSHYSNFMNLISLYDGMTQNISLLNPKLTIKYLKIFVSELWLSSLSIK